MTTLTKDQQAKARKHAKAAKRIIDALAEGKSVCVDMGNESWRRIYGVGIYRDSLVGYQGIHDDDMCIALDERHVAIVETNQVVAASLHRLQAVANDR